VAELNYAEIARLVRALGVGAGSLFVHVGSLSAE
jgi:hypothetical protein